MKLKDFLFLVIVGALILAVMHFWGNNQIAQNNEAALKDKLEHFKLKNGMITSERDVLLVTNKELKEELYIKDDSLKVMTDLFKDFVGTVKIVTETRIDTVEIPVEVPIETNKRYDFAKTTPHFTIAGSIGHSSVRIDSLSMFNTQRLVIGRKKGFWNRTITATVSNSNPYIQTKDLATQIVLEERIKRFGIGPFIGLDFTGSFTVGVGVNYQVWRF